MTDDLLPTVKDTSHSCIFGWPDRPGDTLPPEYPPVDPPDCYPYCDFEDWPPPELPPPDEEIEPPGPLPNSDPYITTPFDIAQFTNDGVFHLWFCRITVSAIGSRDTEFPASAIDDPPFVPPDSGYLYFPTAETVATAFMGVNRIGGTVNRAFVNFDRLKAALPLATQFIAVFSIGWPDGFLPGENAQFGVTCSSGEQLTENGVEWNIVPPTTLEFVDFVNRTHSAVSGFRKVIKIDYTVATKIANVYVKKSPV